MSNNHKIMKNTTYVMTVMVHSWEQHERAIITIGDETDVTWAEEGPNKRTRDNMKKTIVQKVDYKQTKISTENMSVLEDELVETLKNFM